MTQVKVSRLAKLKEAIKAFEAAQNLFCEHGAQDTEPDSVFQWLLADTINCKNVKVPTTIDGWQLYSQKGAGAAAKALAAAATKAVNVIKQTEGGKLGPLKEYLVAYCWRADVEM